jgi:chaperonin cofactor prefoldin
MTNPYQHMAKEFMDLWQKQISTVISDKQFIQAMLEMFQTSQNSQGNEAQRTASSHAANTAAADHGVVAELAFRLAMCEKRIATLEHQAKKSPAKRKPAAAKRVRNSTARRSKKPRQ